MCDPGTAMIVATVASSAVNAYSSVQQGRAAYQSGQYNAAVANRNAQFAENDQALVKEQAANERRRLGAEVRAARGENIARASAMGIDPGFGTPADITGDIEQAGRTDRYIIDRNAFTEIGRLDKEASDYRADAVMSAREGAGALRSGYLGAAGSLLQGASTVASRWVQPRAPTKTTPVGPAKSGGPKVGVPKGR